MDIDDRASWPPAVMEQIQRWSADYGGTARYAVDLLVPLEAELRFRELFAGRLTRVYHCTRLLSHEVQMIRERGLRPLATDLINERIYAAEDTGQISPETASALRAGHAFAVGTAKGRRNQVCLVLSHRVFCIEPGSCEPLLTTWGGEAVYKTSSAQIRQILERVGRPAIVTALIDVSGPTVRSSFHPALHKAFLGSFLGLEEYWADVFFRAPIPPQQIESISQPGDPWYDDFDKLPRD